ncbi:ATP phosphoribosyltransferase [Leucobacter sp. Psy1]|uniref:ATP phosphoribosyltransferase n=1 Tax=Leucobacter sp. Psy1 TaxID=2875729 RepID=UPI001CD31539|nr:ATP phosphoribosyltransferase [Leucobacter sp. Psy1]UBH06327.1 ATP phosphoribosyltransferase [Leucobacter sp. Psy1]
MLRIAVPNKGSLSEVASQMLAEAGYSGRRDSRQLVHTDARNGVEFFYLRPRDIATYVGSGALDVGITGRDLLLDSGSSAQEIDHLDFGDSTFRFAAPAGGEISEIAQLAGRRVATSYPRLVDDFLQTRGVTAELVKLDGAVESSVRLGVADAVADVVSTGATLRAAGLEIFGPVILESTAVLISGEQRHPGIDRLLRRLRGVLVARKFVMVEYDLPADQLEAAAEVAGGVESPTVSPLKDESWVAVRVMIPADAANDVMDRLYELGARAILVTAIHAARL